MILGVGTDLISVNRIQNLIFKFKEIPYDIKKKIIDKCLEKNAGPFALIPDFQKFKSLLLSQKKETPEIEVNDYDELSEARLRGYYDDNIIFCSKTPTDDYLEFNTIKLTLEKKSSRSSSFTFDVFRFNGICSVKDKLL